MLKRFFAFVAGIFSPKKDAPVITQLQPTPKRAPGDDAVVAKPVHLFDPLKDIPSLEDLEDELLAEAKEWLTVREHGYNKGPEVEMFQKFVDGKATSESWCMAFVQYVTGQVCKKYGIKTPLYPSEHCNTVYSHTPEKYLSKVWKRAFAFIMRNPSDNSGHTGFCDDNDMAVEGNTSVAGATDGDGVYFRYRSPKGSTTKPMRGFIDLPLMIQDAIVEARKKAAA